MLWRCSTRGTAGPSGPPGSQPGALGIPALCSLMCSQPLPPQHLTRCWGHWPGATNAVHLSSGNAFSHTVFPFIPPAFFLKPKLDELALIWGSSSESGQHPVVGPCGPGAGATRGCATHPTSEGPGDMPGTPAAAAHRDSSDLQNFSQLLAAFQLQRGLADTLVARFDLLRLLLQGGLKM